MTTHNVTVVQTDGRAINVHESSPCVCPQTCLTTGIANGQTPMFYANLLTVPGLC